MDDAEAAGAGAVERLLRLGKALAGAHVEMAQREASEDSGRLIGAVVLGAIGAVFLLAGALALQVAAALVAHERGLTWAQAVLGLASVDVALGAMSLLLARARLAKPLLVKTRDRLRRSVAVMTDA